MKVASNVRRRSAARPGPAGRRGSPVRRRPASVFEEPVVYRDSRLARSSPVSAERHVDHRLCLRRGRESASVSSALPRNASLGLVRDDADGAGDRIAAEQRALRALYDLGALDVVEGRHHAAGAARPDAVDEHRDRRIAADAEVVGRDAAHRERIGESVLGLAAETRREIDDAADVAHPALLQHLAGEGGYRERHVLQRLLALLRGDDDLVEADDFRRRLRRFPAPARRADTTSTAAQTATARRTVSALHGCIPFTGADRRLPQGQNTRRASGSVQAVDDRRQDLEDPVHLRALDDERRRHGDGVAGRTDQEARLERRGPAHRSRARRGARRAARARCRRPVRRRAGRRRGAALSARARHRSSTAPSSRAWSNRPSR